jgi:hypothetical protein
MLGRRSHARRFPSRPRRVSTPFRHATLIGWSVAAVALVGLAFIVGRPGAEQGVLGATPTPTEPPPLAIVFGTGLDPASNVAVNRTDRFRAGDPFAYSVTLPAASATDTILVQVLRDGPSGLAEVQPPSVQHILPEAATFAFQVRTDDLLAAWGDGSFEMRIFLEADGKPLAVGRFTLLAAPTAEAGG